MIRNNIVVENNNLTVPVNPSTAIAPWGAGVELPGDYADLVEGNLIVRNPNNGVLGFEYPNPFTPENEFEGTIFFQLAGNRISSNQFFGNGSKGGAFRGDVTLVGRLQRNLRLSGIALGKQLRESQSCSPTPRSPRRSKGRGAARTAPRPARAVGLPAVEYLVGLQEEADAIREAVPPVAQPAPPPQPTMPNPCAGVPSNPLCP